MMMPDLEDLHDNGMGENGMGDLGDMGGAPESGLPLLAAEAMSLGRQDGGRRDDRSWSEFLRRQQDINMDSLWDFIRDNKPDSHEGRMVMQNLASAAIYTITAQALQIKRQQDDFKAREKEIKRELKKEEEDAATALYGRWAQGNSMQQYLACIKHRYGYVELERREPPYEEDENGVPVPVASGARWDWHMADWDMREADREAIFNLSARAHELYQVWQDMGRLRRQQNENRARRMPDIDVSDWLAKVKSGKSTNTEKLLGRDVPDPGDGGLRAGPPRRQEPALAPLGEALPRVPRTGGPPQRMVPAEAVHERRRRRSGRRQRCLRR